ncbi:MAG: hypothetical protein ABWX59_00440 [Microbacteriaceae bacterium]
MSREEEHTEPQHRGYVRLVDWVNQHLMGPLGPPPLGPYEDVMDAGVKAVCPVCFHSMGEHVIDHSTPNAVLVCPVDHEPEYESFGPLNEVGMPKRGRGTPPAM